MGWSKKYKRSIDCNNPKGFSQKAHCAGRKKKENVMSSKLEELVGKRLTEEQFDEAAGKKDACYHKVKARYDVWPSAYASGALVKCRKVGAKNWGNKSKKEGLDDLKALPKDLKKSIKKNREEGFASDAQRRAAFASGYKAKGKKKKKKEGVNETTYKFKGYTASKMDELDAMLSRAGIKGTPNFNDMTYSINKKSSKIDRIMKMKGGKKIKPIRLRGKSGMGKISHLGIESVEEARGTCWVGYQQLGMKRKGGKMVPNCVKEVTELYYEVDGKGYGYTFEYINDGKLNEAEYQGRKVKLGKVMQGDVKKFKVYVKNPKGNVVKVNFGHGGPGGGKGMSIRKSNPKARKSFRARHKCDTPGPRWKARYWSCRKW